MEFSTSKEGFIISFASSYNISVRRYIDLPYTKNIHLVIKEKTLDYVYYIFSLYGSVIQYAIEYKAIK